MKSTSRFLISLSNYFNSHRLCFYAWFLMIFVFFSLLMSQQFGHALGLMKLEKRNILLIHKHELLIHEQESFTDDFTKQGMIIQQQGDQIDKMEEYIGELRSIIQLQNQAIKELMENKGEFENDGKFKNPRKGPSGVEA